MTTNEIRVENTKKNLEKLHKKLDRIKTALSTGKNPYCYDEYDFKRTTREIEELTGKLEIYKAKVEAEKNIETIEVIETFLEEWKCKAIGWYKEDFRNLLIYLKERELRKQEFEEWKKTHRDMGERRKKEKELGLDYMSYQEELKERFNSLTIKLMDYRSEWETQLEKWVEVEKVAKRKSLIARVKDIVGEITDATGLYVADNAEINGFIVGNCGKAEVTTISAGGYNIQCFHYRVLVKKIK